MVITYPTFKIGKPCSPSATPEVIRRLPALKVTMSCGGGMGGSRWDEYIWEETNIPTDTIIKVTNILDEEISINTRFVVKSERVDILVVEHDVTDFVNYHSKNCDTATNVHYIAVKPNQPYAITDRYDDWTNHCSEKVVKTIRYRDGECVEIR